MADSGRSARRIDYGLNYLPTVTLVEGFRPFWIPSRFGYEQMRADLLGMPSLNARFVRFHLIPCDPRRDRYPGIEPSTVLQHVDRAAQFAVELGMAVHMDLWARSILDITEEDVTRRVTRLRGIARSYQLGNEEYGISKDYDGYLNHLRALIAAGKASDPAARLSLDLLPEDLRYVHENHPALYELLDMVLIRFYAMSDHRGWTPTYVEQLVWYCGGEASGPDALDGPLVIIGNAERCFYASVIERANGLDRTRTPRCRSSVSVVERPFRHLERASAAANAIGYACSPACLYLFGADDAGLRRAVYDLIRRLWLDRGTAAEPDAPRPVLTGTERRLFRADVSPGPYSVTIAFGGGDAGSSATVFSVNGRPGGRCVADREIRSRTVFLDHVEDRIVLDVESAPESRWAIGGLTIMHAGMLAEYHEFVFASCARDHVGPEGAARVVLPWTACTAATGHGWCEP